MNGDSAGDEPFTLTLQIDQDRQEVIQIQPGMDVEQIADDFCLKYGFDNSFSQLIVGELKRQITEHFGEDALQNYTASKASKKTTGGNNEKLPNSVANSRAKTPPNNNGANKIKPKVDDGKIPKKTGRESQLQAARNKSNERKELNGMKEPDSPGSKLRRYLRATDQQKRSNLVQVDNTSSFKSSMKNTPKMTPHLEIPPNHQQNDYPDFGPNDTPINIRYPSKPANGNVSSQPNLFNTQSSLSGPPSPQANAQFGKQAHDEDHVSMIYPMNKTDNQSDIQSMMNMERELDQDNEEELKGIFENSAYFKATKKRAIGGNATNPQTNRESVRDRDDQSKSSMSFTNTGVSPKKVSLSPNKTKGYAINPETGRIESAKDSKLKSSLPKGPYHPANITRTPQTYQSQRSSAQPFTIPLPEPDEDIDPPHRPSHQGREPFHHMNTFPDKSAQGLKHANDFRIDEHADNERMRQTYEGGFKKQSHGGSKNKRDKSSNQRSDQHGDDNFMDLDLIERLGEEVRAIEDRVDMDKKSSILTFHLSESKEKNSLLNKGKKSSPQSQNQPSDPSVYIESREVPKQAMSDTNQAKRQGDFIRKQGIPSHSSNRAFRKSLNSNSTKRTPFTNLAEGHHDQQENHENSFDPKKTLTRRTAAQLDKRKNSTSRSPMKNSGFISHRDLPANHHNYHQNEKENYPDNLPRNPSRSKERRKSKSITPIDRATYEKLQKRPQPAGKSKLMTYEEKQLREVRSRPSISPKSKEIYQKLNRGEYKTPQDRIFYKGIESIKKKEELSDIEFSRTHTFKPNPTKEVKAVVTQEDIDRLVYSYKDKDIMLARKYHQHVNYDPVDGKKLYTPRVNKSPGVKHKYTLKEIDEWNAEMREFVSQLKQIFDFLDVGATGTLHGARIAYENIHPGLLEMLQDILMLVIKRQTNLTFQDFYELVLRNDLSHQVAEVFEILDKQPLINPKKLKEKNFKFTN